MVGKQYAGLDAEVGLESRGAAESENKKSRSRGSEPRFRCPQIRC
jgi:hypothetical protein